MRSEDKRNLYGWFLIVGVTTALAMILLSCDSLKRPTLVGGGAGGGAAVGTLVAGPAGAIGGAVVGGVVASAIVETDIAADKQERLEDKIISASNGKPPPPEPWLIERVPWWGWLVALWLWLRRAHLSDALTGKEPRMDAILRALGWRTHRTPIPARKP